MQTRFVVARVASLLVAISCFDQRQAPEAPTSPSFAKGGGGPKLRSISVSPSSVTVTTGQTIQLTATASPPGTATTFTWASSNTAVATVSTSGLVTAAGQGTASVTASSGGVTGSATITVTSVSSDPVLVGAGDIASCSSSGDEATATLLDGIPGSVVTLGDNAYDNGTTTERRRSTRTAMARRGDVT